MFSQLITTMPLLGVGLGWAGALQIPTFILSLFAGTPGDPNTPSSFPTPTTSGTPAIISPANLEVLMQKFQKLSYHDQHVVTAQCTTAILDQMKVGRSFLFGWGLFWV
jgi:hypothetical protein